MAKKIGIIDLGSNSVRLVIFEIKSTGAYKLIDDINDTIRLSENMVEGKYINDIAMHKAVKTVKLYKKLCSAYGIPSSGIIAVATEAVRKAENKEQFLSLLRTGSGLTFRVLSGKEECTYVYNGVINSIDVNNGIIVDIGGGSTEIIQFKDRIIKNSISIPIGSVTATEWFLDKNSITDEMLSKLDKNVLETLQNLDWLTQNPHEVIVGVGGTIRALAKFHRTQIKYPLNLVHNYVMDINGFESVYSTLKDLNLQSRRKALGNSSGRADIIMGGLEILKAIITVSSSSKLIVSGYGLREGILLEYIFRTKNARRFEDVLDFSLNNFIDLYGMRQEHANHVCYLSLTMFDQLKELHGLGAEERKLLKIASLLHDIGISINYYDHHRHSFHLILNSRINGLSHRELVLVSAIAASHSRNDFRENWKSQYKMLLQPDDDKIYQILSLFLKISECLDRSEMGIVRSLDCQIYNNSVKIQTIREGDAELELNLANEYGTTFKKFFGKMLSIT